MRCLLVLFICASAAVAKETCCDDAIGCFNDDAPFDNLPLPECPNKIGVNFRVYDRSHSTKTKSEIITRYKIAAIWKPERRTVFIVHGYLQGENALWMSSLKDEFLMREDYNVIIVGWGGGSRHVWYPSSASNVRTVGAEIALVASNLLNIGGTTADDLYCLGHSLGAHACGHAGMRSHFHRVTGMDPAGPWFENKPWEIGLNPGVADHVDVIHTNGEPGISLILNLGTMKAMGDVDFYPNGGGSQPGCYIDVYEEIPDMYADRPAVTEEEANNGKLDPSETGMVAGIGADGFVRVVPGGEEGVTPEPYGGLMPHCSHNRVLDLYEESINNPTAFISAHACINSEDVPGSCGPCEPHCPPMGYHAEEHWFEPISESDESEARRKPLFWLETNKNSPYSKT